jgi:hypothetical protein
MVSNEIDAAMQAVINERLQAIESQIRNLQSYVAQGRDGSVDGVNAVQLSEEERQAIRSVLESNSAIGPSAASARSGLKILVMVDPPGVCFDYTR